MATPPLICSADIANSLIERTYFDRCTLLVTRDQSLINSMNFCNYSMDIDDFFTQSLRLKANTAFLLDDASLGTYYGGIKFLLVKVTYPASFTTYTDRFIYLKYLGNSYPISELNIWTGNPGVNPASSILVTPGNSEYSSPYFDTGGMVLYNPHNIYVDLDIIIASSVPPVGTTDVNNQYLGDQDGDFLLI